MYDHQTSEHFDHNCSHNSWHLLFREDDNVELKHVIIFRVSDKPFQVSYGVVLYQEGFGQIHLEL